MERKFPKTYYTNEYITFENQINIFWLEYQRKDTHIRHMILYRKASYIPIYKIYIWRKRFLNIHKFDQHIPKVFLQLKIENFVTSGINSINLIFIFEFELTAMKFYTMQGVYVMYTGCPHRFDLSEMKELGFYMDVDIGFFIYSE